MLTFNVPSELVDETVYEYSSSEPLCIFSLRVRRLPLSKSQQGELLHQAADVYVSDFNRKGLSQAARKYTKEGWLQVTIKASDRRKRNNEDPGSLKVYVAFVDLAPALKVEVQGVFAGKKEHPQKLFGKVLKSMQVRKSGKQLVCFVEEGRAPKKGLRQAGPIEFKLPVDFHSSDQFEFREGEQKLQLNFQQMEPVPSQLNAVFPETVLVPTSGGRMMAVEKPPPLEMQGIPQVVSTFSSEETERLLHIIGTSLKTV